MSRLKSSVMSIQTPKFKMFQSSLGSIKGEHESLMKSCLISSSKFSYLMQKLPQAYQDHVIEEMITNEQIIDETRFNLKPTTKSSKIYKSKSGKMKVEVDNWMCCIFNSGKSWETRDCYLRENVLQVGNKGNKDTYYICFDTLSVTIEKMSSIRFKIKVTNREQKNYLFEGETEDECDEWYNTLSDVIQKSYGQKFSLKQELRYENFDQYEYITQKDFVQRCNCGDIILFKDNSNFNMAKLQRLITLSDFDHVGVILKNRRNEVFIFESTTSAGVSIMKWRHFMKYRFYDFTQRIVWRRLAVDLNSQDIATFEAFVENNLSKQYMISIQRLIMLRSKIPALQNQQAKKEEKQGYFCSELVAALYKNLGLLEPVKSSGRYYPGTFSKDLALLRGELGPLVTIVFEEELIEEGREQL